jgi:alkylation response protein AidB-like acyl-CoA dehydrogenase
VVRTPAGFKDAFRQFVEGGWNALVLPAKWGGQGFRRRSASWSRK